METRRDLAEEEMAALQEYEEAKLHFQEISGVSQSGYASMRDVESAYQREGETLLRLFEASPELAREHALERTALAESLDRQWRAVNPFVLVDAGSAALQATTTPEDFAAVLHAHNEVYRVARARCRLAFDTEAIRRHRPPSLWERVKGWLNCSRSH